MTDDEVLKQWRRRYGRITLSQAKDLEQLDRRFSHLSARNLDPLTR